MPVPLRHTTRIFSASTRRLASGYSGVPKKPVGAFRGGIFGFLLGSTVTGAAGYFYVYEEYKVSNDLLTEDIDALRKTIERVEIHTRALEEQVSEQAAQKSKGKK